MKNNIVEVRINKWTGLYSILYDNKEFEQTLYPQNVDEINKFLETAKYSTVGLNLIFKENNNNENKFFGS